MNKRHLISIDLDGTLLRKDYTVSAFTIGVLTQLEKQGDIIFLNSGRPIRTLEHFHKIIGLTSPYCAYAGSFVGLLDSPCLPHFDPHFKKEDILPYLKPLEPNLLFFMGENHRCHAQNHPDPFMEKYFPCEGIASSYIQSLDELMDEMKILVVQSKIDVKEYLESRLPLNSPIRVHKWKEDDYYEIIISGVDKGTAISLVAQTYGIDKENIYAFGDSLNDYPMLEVAGHPYALLGCKSSRLAKAFPATIKSNAEDGVAYQLLTELGA